MWAGERGYSEVAMRRRRTTRRRSVLVRRRAMFLATSMRICV